METVTFIIVIYIIFRILTKTIFRFTKNFKKMYISIADILISLALLVLWYSNFLNSSIFPIIFWGVFTFLTINVIDGFFSLFKSF